MAMSRKLFQGARLPFGSRAHEDAVFEVGAASESLSPDDRSLVDQPTRSEVETLATRLPERLVANLLVDYGVDAHGRERIAASS
jgi:hypothetical protein